MYAVIELQGTQILVKKDDKITVNRMEEQKTSKFKCDKILFGKKGSSYFVGEPYVKDAYVDCEITGDSRLKKVIAFKYRDRKSSQSKKGHRQDVTNLVVKDIHFKETKETKETKTETKTAKVPKKEVEEVKTPKAAAKKPAAKKTETKK